MTWTLLHDACVHQDTPHVIEIAHAHSEQALKVDDHGLTPLHILVWGRNPSAEAVKALLAASPQVASDRDVHGDTPLHLACSNPNADERLIKRLVDACPTAVSMKNHEGLMPLHMACRYAPQNEAVIALLVETYPYALLSPLKIGNPAPRKLSVDNTTTTEHARHDVVNPVSGMSAKSSIDYRYEEHSTQIRDGAFPLHMAVAAGAPLRVIELLVREGRAVLLQTNKYGETPLHVALVSRARDGVIECLIRNGPDALRVRDATAARNLPVHAAAASGFSSVRVAQMLLEKWPELVLDRNGANLTPLELAAQSGKCSDGVLRFLEMTAESII